MPCPNCRPGVEAPATNARLRFVARACALPGPGSRIRSNSRRGEGF